MTSFTCTKLVGCDNIGEPIVEIDPGTRKLIIRTYRVFEFCHPTYHKDYLNKPVFILIATLSNNEEVVEPRKEFYSLYYTERLTEEFVSFSFDDNTYSIKNCKGVVEYEEMPTARDMLRKNIPFNYTIKACNLGFDKKVEKDIRFSRYMYLFA